VPWHELTVMNSPVDGLTSEVQDLIHDLTLEEAGIKIYYAVDADQIKDFCYPVDPRVGAPSKDINELADDQVALEELFSSARKCFIPPEYEAEVEGLAHYLLREIETAQNSYAVLETLVRRAPDLASDSGRSEVLAEVEKHFTLAVALALGLHTYGGTRFLEVFRSIREKTADKAAKQHLAVIEHVSRGIDYQSFADRLMTAVRRNPEFGYKFRKMDQGSLKVDLTAIARLLMTNHALTEQFQQGKIATGLFILYVSSNARSRDIFTLPEVQHWFPIHDGRPVSLLRNASHFLHYRVVAGTVPSQGKISEILQGFQSILGDLHISRKIRDPQESDLTPCGQCVLRGESQSGLEGCSWAPVCSRVADLEQSIANHRRGVQNLGLLAQITKFSTTILPVRAGTSPKLAAYLSLFNRAVAQHRDQPEMAKESLERLRELQRLFVIKRRFKEFLADEFSHLPPGAFLRKGRDIVSSIVQYLPMYPRLNDEPRRRIIEIILEYFKAPPEALDRVAEPKLEAIQRAYRAYTDLDIDQTSLTADHELLRCYLLMAFPSVEGDERAHMHAKEMYEYFGQKAGLEFLYVLVWTSRRQLRSGKDSQSLFSEGEQWGLEGLRVSSNDPRFYHGLGLLHYSWAKMVSATEASRHIRRAIEYIQKALEQYLERGVGPELVAICQKDLALFFSDPDGGSERDIPKAETALVQLQKSIPPEEWFPLYPEFFHAKAQVLFAVCEQSGRLDSDLALEAHDAAELALKMYDKDSFRATLEDINAKSRFVAFPRIRILRQPEEDRTGSFSGTGELSGFIVGVTPSMDYALVLYVRTDKWYLQWPGGTSKLIRCTPLWHASVHLGRRYAAILVTTNYIPLPIFYDLPSADKHVLAVVEVPPR
jgi:hypothetical protein